MDYRPPGSPVRGDYPCKNTGPGCHALLQGIFLETPGWAFLAPWDKLVTKYLPNSVKIKTKSEGIIKQRMMHTIQFYKNQVISHCSRWPTARNPEWKSDRGTLRSRKIDRTGLQIVRNFRRQFYELSSLYFPILREALKPLRKLSVSCGS